MVTKVTIPKPSTNIEEVMLTAWLKKEGDVVQKGEPLAELTTDKAVFDLESPRSGVLRKIFAPEKSTLPVGYIVALIAGPSDKLPDVTKANTRILERYRKNLQGQKTGKKVAPPRSASGMHVRATPSARRIASAHQIDLSDVVKKMNVDVVTESVIKTYLEKYSQQKGG
jgi:pyruvate/2-oxoglutarate dehydrogenase complex dihydrolipoamide acyltransferase (E2) component